MQGFQSQSLSTEKRNRSISKADCHAPASRIDFRYPNFKTRLMPILVCIAKLIIREAYHLLQSLTPVWRENMGYVNYHVRLRGCRKGVLVDSCTCSSWELDGCPLAQTGFIVSLSSIDQLLNSHSHGFYLPTEVTSVPTRVSLIELDDFH